MTRDPHRAHAPAPTYTGERPCWGRRFFGYDEARALAPYAHVAGLAAGKRVLDAGCGEGFGTRMLADVAKSVEGIDHSERAITYCRRAWPRPNLVFRTGDLTRPEVLRSSYDLVINFQVLEHIEDDRGFLHTLKSQLAPEGILVVVTPNRLTSFSQNPYHVREYTPAELTDRLEEVFGCVEMLGVHGSEKVLAFDRRRKDMVDGILRLDPLGLRRVLPRAVVTFGFARLAVLVRLLVGRTWREDEFDVDDFHVSGEKLDEALDLLAVCRS